MATAMTAVLAGSLYAMLSTAFTARRTAHGAIDPVRRAELAVELMRADIESAVVPKGILAGGFLGEDAFDASGKCMDGLMLHGVASGAVDADAEGAGDVRRVELACEPGDGGRGMVLVRRVWRCLLATHVEEPAAEVLCRGVRSLDLKYHDGTDWQDSWDSATRDNSLPLAVRVTLELDADIGSDPDAGRDADARGYTVIRIFRVPLATSPDQQQLEASAE